MKTSFVKESTIKKTINTEIEALKVNDNYCVVKHTTITNVIKNGKNLKPVEVTKQYFAKNDDIFNGDNIRKITKEKRLSLKDYKTGMYLEPILSNFTIDDVRKSKKPYDFMQSQHKNKKVFDYFVENPNSKLFFSLWGFCLTILDENQELFFRLSDGGNTYFLSNYKFDLDKILEIAKNSKDIIILNEKSPIESVPHYNMAFEGHEYIKCLALITDKDFDYSVYSFDAGNYLIDKYGFDKFPTDLNVEELEDEYHSNWN